MFDVTDYTLNNPYARMEQLSSYIRILHASPDAPPVDIYANDKLIAKNLSYRNFTPYLNVPEGNTNIRVFSTGRKVNPVINTNIFIPSKSIFTITISGSMSQIGLLTLPEPPKTISKGKSLIRFANLSPDAPEVDVLFPNNTKLFSNVSYKEYSDYVSIDGGTYSFEVRTSGSNKVLLLIPKVIFKPDNIYTIYLIGFANKKPSLQVLVPLDGNTYLKV